MESDKIPKVPAVTESGASGKQQTEQEPLNGEVLSRNITRTGYETNDPFITTLDEINSSRQRGISSDNTMLVIAKFRENGQQLSEIRQELADTRMQLKDSEKQNAELQKELAVEKVEHNAASKANWSSTTFLVIGGLFLAAAFFPKNESLNGRDWVFFIAATICYIAGVISQLKNEKRSEKL